LIYLLVNSFLRLTSHHRYAGALGLQLLGFCWFVGTAIFYYGECVKNISLGYDIEGFSSLATSGSSLSFKEMVFSFILRAELILPYLSIAYLILITCLTLKVVKAYKNTQTLRYQGLQKIDVNWRLFVSQISNQLGIKRTVRVYISSLIESPVTIGFLKPLILLPVAVINNLSTEQIEAILIHEMAHIKRNDYFINILVSIVEVTLFFNPFMQLISKQMKRERENSCDDWVLQYEYNACNYARALLKIATYKTINTHNLAVHAVDNRRALLIRVKRMIEKKDLYNTYRQQLVSLIFITAAITSLAWFAPKKYPTTSMAQATTDVKTIAEPLVAKVENPLFNPVFFLAEDDKKAISTELKKAEAEIKKSAQVTSKTPVLQNVEKEIVDQFIPSKVALKESRPQLKEVHSVNLVLDTALFKRYATRSLVVAEIKKLKKEFEALNKSSLFQNVDWKQFWENTKVQKQLETAFEQLKALEIEQKQNLSIATTAVKKTTVDGEAISNEQEQLKALTSKKLATIVKDRITDLKKEQSGFSKSTTELNFNFDLPDFTTLNIPKDNFAWSYTYNPKTRTVVKTATTPKPSATGSCKDVKDNTRTKMIDSNGQEITQPEVREERPRTAPVIRTLRVVRI
jgi:beta-lactamase regulating signal transducer with metallopeptidase domain